MIFIPIINIIIAPSLNHYTAPKDETNDTKHDDFTYVLLFLGIFCIPFIKRIRKTRSIWYFENIIENKKIRLKRLNHVHGYTDEIETSKLEKEIFLLERKIKLKKLK